MLSDLNSIAILNNNYTALDTHVHKRPIKYMLVCCLNLFCGLYSVQCTLYNVHSHYNMYYTNYTIDDNRFIVYNIYA